MRHPYLEGLTERIDRSVKSIEEELTRLGLSLEKVQEGKERLKQTVISEWTRSVLGLCLITFCESDEVVEEDADALMKEKFGVKF